MRVNIHPPWGLIARICNYGAGEGHDAGVRAGVVVRQDRCFGGPSGFQFGLQFDRISSILLLGTRTGQYQLQSTWTDGHPPPLIGRVGGFSRSQTDPECTVRMVIRPVQIVSGAVPSRCRPGKPGLSVKTSLQYAVWVYCRGLVARAPGDPKWWRVDGLPYRLPPECESRKAIINGAINAATSAGRTHRDQPVTNIQRASGSSALFQNDGVGSPSRDGAIPRAGGGPPANPRHRLAADQALGVVLAPADRPG